MKILQVINSLHTGGAEKLLIESIPLYIEKGLKVDVLLLNDDETVFRKKLEETKVCNIITFKNKSVYNPFLIFKIIPFLKNYDVIHVHLFPSLYWVAFAKIFSLSKTKLVYTEHSTTNRRRENFILSKIDKIVYSKYNSIIAITNEVLQNLNSHLNYKNNNQIKVIKNGLNLDAISNATAYSKTDFFEENDAKIVIQVARFLEPKDQQTLIKSLSLLPENIKLILVGDGSLLYQSKQLVLELNLQKKVLFLGVRMDVLALLKTSDIIVLSSKHEGLSLSCIEGMASGKPFVASNVPGLKEVVQGNGVLFESGNANDLANKISNLLNDENYYNEIISSCLKKSTEYDIHLMIDNYIKLYESVK